MDLSTLTSDDYCRYLVYGAAALYLADTLVRFFREGVRSGVTALVVWGAVGGGAVAAYAHRDAITAVATELATGPTQVVSPATAGRVVLKRSPMGQFMARGSVDGAQVSFTIDTGASSVTLCADDAIRAGIDLGSLVYDVPVATANGRAYVARVSVPEISIGGLVEHDVDALVAQPGQLGSSLLGMSWLGRLSEFRVAGDRLEMLGGARQVAAQP